MVGTISNSHSLVFLKPTVIGLKKSQPYGEEYVRTYGVSCRSSSKRFLPVFPRSVNCTETVVYRVVYHGGSSRCFGIGILPVSDVAGIGIFGRYSRFFRLRSFLKK
jgi:hypothetical protein